MKTLMVHVVLYREDTYFLAHCLEFDLVAQGDTPDEAYQNLLDAIDLQTQFVREHDDLANLIQPAPLEYWQLLANWDRFTPQSNGWKLPPPVAAIDCGLVNG